MWNLAEFEYVLRLLMSALCGVVIGCERKNRAKEAGVRTHCVVACASTLMMILSKYAYADVMSMYGDLMGIDPSRIASGVVSGIGFLGAGVIFVHNKTVTGLTTAAGIWATSGVGMAIGAGMYILGGAAALIIVLIQMILHIRIRKGKFRAAAAAKNSGNDVDSIIRAIEDRGYEVLSKDGAVDIEEGSGDDGERRKTCTITFALNGEETHQTTC